METDLLGFVQTQFKERRFKLTEVALGSGVPYETVKKIANGTTPNPGVLHVQRLAGFFAGKQAERAAAVENSDAG